MINKIKEFGLFLKEIYQKRSLVFSLAKNDFKARNAGSFLGVFWSFIIPLISIFVFWFVFNVGFKNPPVNNIEFIAWFMPAYVPWMFFTESIQNSVGVLYEFHYLVKKVKFRTALLPIVKIESTLMLNLFFIALMFVILLIYHVRLTLTAFQIVYYMIGLIIFCTGLSWIVSSIAVFFKDMSAIVNVICQLGFWLTPIFWTVEGMPPWVAMIARLNPMAYICTGFRNCLLYEINFWQNPRQTLYFWCITVIIFIGGAMLFRKLRPHFADVL